MDINNVATDLIAEQEALLEVMLSIGDNTWSKPTSSPRWNIADQIGHLTYFDEAAAVAITDPNRFRTMVDDLTGVIDGGNSAIDDLTLKSYRSMSPTELLQAWQTGHQKLRKAAATLENDSRVIWYGPSMGAKSFLTSRLMETWAHGQDVIDTTDSFRPATDRLRHIAQLGVITRQWSYINRQLDIPDSEVQVELTGPSGDTWSWGSGNTENLIRGSAEDFCLVVTQRRHFKNTELEVRGGDALDWLEKAQAFAGPPTSGPSEQSM